MSEPVKVKRRQTRRGVMLCGFTMGEAWEIVTFADEVSVDRVGVFLALAAAEDGMWRYQKRYPQLTINGQERPASYERRLK